MIGSQNSSRSLKTSGLSYVSSIQMAVNNIQFTKIEIQMALYLLKQYKEGYNANHFQGNWKSD